MHMQGQEVALGRKAEWARSASSCGPPAGIDTAVLVFRVPNADTGDSPVASEPIDGAPSPNLLLLLR